MHILGGGFGYRNVYLIIGGHAFRRPEPAGGFKIGDTLPEKFPAVPVRRETDFVFSIGLSYKLPL